MKCTVFGQLITIQGQSLPLYSYDTEYTSSRNVQLLLTTYVLKQLCFCQLSMRSLSLE